ncbi:hypothetical protein AAHB37_19220 [Glutamicibacter halophytocola]
MTTTTARRAAMDVAPKPTKNRRKVSPGRIVAWAVMILVIIVTLFPFYWMLRTALSTNPGPQANPASWLPPEFTLGAFERVLGLQDTEQAIAEGGSGTQLNFWRYLLNSVFVSTLITVCQLAFSAMAAFAFSRLTWPGRDKVFAIFIGGLMVPSIFTLLAKLCLDQATRPDRQPCGHCAAHHVHDPFCGIFLPAVLPECAQGNRRGRFA